MARITLSEGVGGSGPGVGLRMSVNGCVVVKVGYKIKIICETYCYMYLTEGSMNAIGSVRIWGEDGGRMVGGRRRKVRRTRLQVVIISCPERGVLRALIRPLLLFIWHPGPQNRSKLG